MRFSSFILSLHLLLVFHHQKLGREAIRFCQAPRMESAKVLGLREKEASFALQNNALKCSTSAFAPVGAVGARWPAT
jgi:hypothetical protein